MGIAEIERFKLGFNMLSILCFYELINIGLSDWLTWSFCVMYDLLSPEEAAFIQNIFQMNSYWHLVVVILQGVFQ